MKLILAVLLITLCQLAATAQNIMQAEYFFDGDAGFGQNSPLAVTPLANGTFPLMINISGVSPGFHKLYIRAKDENGNWSHTSRRTIEVVPTQAISKIVTGEYYFDLDPGFGNATSITISPQNQVILQNFTASVNNLSNGFHKLYGRLKDDLGNWSQTFRRTIEIAKRGDNAVMTVEYFFETDEGVGNCASQNFAVPLADGSYTFTIPLNQLVNGADTLFTRVMDSTNHNWSITAYTVNPFYLPLTLLQFTGSLINNTVHLQWQTTNEMHTGYFIIERSTDARNYQAVGTVKAKGIATGNTDYNAEDIPGLTGNIYYRLKQVDLDGHYTYSKAIMVSVNTGRQIFTIQPNPARSYFVISQNQAIPAGATLKLIDVKGRVVLTQKLAGSRQTINISTLPKAMYLVSIETANGSFHKKLLVN